MRSIRPDLPLQAPPLDTRLGAARGLLSRDKGRVSPVGAVIALAMLAAGGFLFAYMTLPEQGAQTRAPERFAAKKPDPSIRLATEESR